VFFVTLETPRSLGRGGLRLAPFRFGRDAHLLRRKAGIRLAVTPQLAASAALSFCAMLGGSSRWTVFARASRQQKGRQGLRDGRGRKVPSPARAEDTPLRTTKVVLAAAHLDHNPGHSGRRHRNVKALCQRCHLLHDRPEHQRRIRLTLR
jgi:hypothetical protein